MSLRVDVISIGTLSRNRLWGETSPVRTAHATTVLIRAGKRNILVDPALPAVVLNARLGERAGVKPEQIDTVFLTNFRRAHRGGLALFDRAEVFASETEVAYARATVGEQLEQSGQDMEPAHRDAEAAALDRLKVAPDKLAPGVDLFPLPGYTPGQSGLLVGMTTLTMLVAGDAVPTLDHFLAGQTLPDAASIEQALESMREVYEIADIVIPGHDNLFINPRTQGM